MKHTRTTALQFYVSLRLCRYHVNYRLPDARKLPCAPVCDLHAAALAHPIFNSSVYCFDRLRISFSCSKRCSRFTVIYIRRISHRGIFCATHHEWSCLKFFSVRAWRDVILSFNCIPFAHSPSVAWRFRDICFRCLLCHLYTQPEPDRKQLFIICFLYRTSD